jgi:NADPH2:quinone reductase
VAIDVQLANITFVETQVRAGRAPNPAMAPALPAIPGNGVGGRVREVGDGVDPALLGVRGETVLVEAAAGGVGSLLVQLARNAGATVVAAAGEPRKLELAAELGAEMAVDYTEDGWAKLVREQLGGVDVVFDGVGGAVARSAFGLVRAGGRFCGFGLASGTWAQLPEADGGDVTVLRGTGMTPDESLELTRAALAEATAGRLRPVIGQTFPLERAADAHAAIEARATIGKTLLIVAPETDGR